MESYSVSLELTVTHMTYKPLFQKCIYLGLLMLLSNACDNNETNSEKMNENLPNYLPIFDLEFSLLKQDIKPREPIGLSIYVINRSQKTDTILRSQSNITSIKVSGWKNKELNGFVYNGPATSVVAPNDSAYFGVDDITGYFNTITLGENALSIEFTIYTMGRKDPIVLSGTVPIIIKEK